MTFLCLVLPVLLARADPPPPEPGGHADLLFEACGRDPYFRGKRGFPDVVRTKDHAYKEFKREVRHGRLDPNRGEFFSYLYTLDLGHRTLFFHSQWRPAVFEKAEGGSLHHLIQSPLVPTGTLRIYSMMHSHPAWSAHGAGPSRVDLATASTYRNPDGSFRYLYLINNYGKLIQFRARREVNPADPAAVATLPLRPKVRTDWID